jgi:hypothetical protein
MSITLFEVSPIGRGVEEANRRLLCVSTKPFISVLPKTTFKKVRAVQNQPPSLLFFFYSFFIKLMGGAQFAQVLIVSKLPLS